MKLENAIRALAGTMILTSLALAHYVSPNWLWLTAFVGANLFQSAFTGFYPAENILRKLGVGVTGCTRVGLNHGALHAMQHISRLLPVGLEEPF